MRSRYKISNPHGLFFISSTIVEWIPVFTNEKYFQIISESISYCQNNKGLEIYAYVIMDNHFHMVCKDLKLTETMRSIKGFTASRIIEEIQKDNKAWLINQFSYFKKAHKKETNYQVWQESFHPQEILTEEILHQKIEYIHYNPVKRGFVIEAEHWKYSSANFYKSGIHGPIKINSF